MLGKLTIFCVLLIAVQGLNLKQERHMWAQNQGLASSKNPWYTFRENGRCQGNEQCDGQRWCSYWVCQGVARQPKNQKFVYDENITCGKCPTSSDEISYTNRNYYCTGLRRCSDKGFCEDLPPKGPDYRYPEIQTHNRCPFPNDPNYPIRHYFCDGARTCSDLGWCQGVSR